MTEPQQGPAAPIFSIVTICFNNIGGLAKTGDSISSQTESGYEWIVIDGGSTDGTIKYLDEQSSRLAHCVSEPDKGIYDAMGKGLARARGNYVIFMNAGDLFYDEQVLGAVTRSIGDHPFGLIYGDSIETDGRQSFYKKARKPANNKYVMFTHHQALFYNTKVAQQVGFDQSYRFSADWVFTAGVLNKVGSNIAYYQGPVCRFERGGVSQQGIFQAVMHRELLRIYREVHRHGTVKAYLLWSVKVAINRARSFIPVLYDKVRYR